MSSTKTGTQTSTQTTAPWSGQQPYYSDIFANTQNAYNSGQLSPTAYTGEEVAAPGATTQQSQQMIQNAAQNSSIPGYADNLTNSILQGNQLDPTKNPGFQQGLNDIKTAYSNGTAAQTDAAAARDGAYGGSAYNELTGLNNQAYNNSLNDFMGNLYSQGLQQQTNTLANSPNINNANYTAGNQVGQVGSAQDAYQQNLINEQISKFLTNQQAPLAGLQNYSALIGNNLGGTTQSSAPIYTNYWNTGLGAAGSGAGLATMALA